ncbi:MAG: hypothetical protein ACOX8S_05090 [Christensenellales bacterium]|jgi:hypothetical protein
MNPFFKDPGLEYSIDSIMMFQDDQHSDWWRDSLFAFYPRLDRAYFDSLDTAGRSKYLHDVLSEAYSSIKEEIALKTKLYRDHWLKHSRQIEAAFIDAFGIDVRRLFNDITVNITLNPISPRFLKERAFDVFYLNSERGALGISIHEMIHFLWFHVWQGIFGDDYSEYETPNLKWVLSEMVVDIIMRDERLSKINPYFESGCAYEYFYSMNIEEKPILEMMNELYKRLHIEEFMKQSFSLCQKHEDEISAQMK